MTILFVSHDPNAVRALCSRAVLLHAGCMQVIGKPTDVLNRYQKLIMAREDAYEAGQPATEEAISISAEDEGGPGFLTFTVTAMAARKSFAWIFSTPHTNE